MQCNVEDILRVKGSQKNCSQDGKGSTLGSWGAGTDVLFPEAQLEVCPWSALPLDLAQKEREHLGVV